MILLMAWISGRTPVADVTGIFVIAVIGLVLLVICSSVIIWRYGRTRQDKYEDVEDEAEKENESWATPNWSKGSVGQEESRSQIPSRRSSIPNPRSRIPNPQFQFPGPRSQIPNPKTCKVWLRL